MMCFTDCIPSQFVLVDLCEVKYRLCMLAILMYGLLHKCLEICPKGPTSITTIFFCVCKATN